MQVRIRTFATSLAMAAGLAGSCLMGRVQAADFTSHDAYDGQTVSAAVYDWTGFYVGAHGGYGRPSAGAAGLGGFLGGLQLGYAVQSDRLVLGVEGDLGVGDASGSRRSLGWLGSARARAGFAFNQYFVYGTGGFGFGTLSAADGPARQDRWNLGWILGIGAEVALSRTWTARVEAFRYDLGRADDGVAGGPAPMSLAGTIVRVGVDYRF